MVYMQEINTKMCNACCHPDMQQKCLICAGVKRKVVQAQLHAS